MNRPAASTLALTLALFCPLLSAQAPDPCATAPQTCATLINTHATAEMRLPSTAVDFAVAISAVDKDLPIVQRQLSDRSVALLTWLRGQNVQRLVTSSLSFSPETRSSDSRRDKTVGYDGDQRVTFRTTPDKVSDLLAGVLTHGANTIKSVVFTPTEQEIAAARQQLSADATRTALAQADSIAKAAGMRAVSVRSINVQEASLGSGNRGYANQVYVDGLPGGLQNKLGDLAGVATEAGDSFFATRVDLTVAAVK